MIRIRYIAKRAISGHAIGDPVELSFSVAEMTPGRRVTRDTQKTLSGRRETLLHHGLRTWSIVTEPLAATRLDAFEEFLTAVEDGSEFGFEPWWMIGAAAAAEGPSENRLRTAPTVRCVLASESYDLARIAGNGNGGADDWYQISFQAEEAP